LKPLPELTTHCIRCGFCLEACPTYSETGNELQSPRGRIYLVRSADEGRLRWQEDVRPHLEPCLGCRACETACPSGVEYGAILELARDRIEQDRPNFVKKALLRSTTEPGLLKVNLALGRLWPGDRVPGFVSRALSGHEAEVDLPQAEPAGNWPPIPAAELPELRGEVYLLEGCAMRVLYPRVHQATRRLLRRVGYAVREVPQGCCGALHAHSGYLASAREMARDLVKAFADREIPVVVNSAGCGSTIKEYGALIGEDAFARRTQDISEFLLEAGLTVALQTSPGLEIDLTYHDACHLAHGQRIRLAPRELLRAIPGVRFVELEEADTCCGSAGVYNVLQPQMARRLLERKWGHIQRTQATVVATGNPGCHAWMAQAAREHERTVLVHHTAEVLEMAFSVPG
jgi:glycolate oxidase iron-sulfur subunit